MQNKSVIALLVAAAWSVSAAHAESTSESLTRIEAETMVLKAREKQLEVQSSIVTRQNEIAARQSMTAALAQSQNQVEAVGEPVVRAIEGIGSRMYATLQLGDGSLVDVQQGDTLPGGMKIVAVHPREVLASNKGRQFRLGMYAPSLNGFNPNFPAPAVGVASNPGRGVAR
ncbi:type IV pilus biogenesis protein PilP [Herbaspirillum sp. YR522]|uniref:type IV pilus biogenesis protein PilP n=1 Tax=Herbaspirillum sp. YR522 TaxID=1144342 RepID=UPI00026F913C|nr:type IV pilus biogenesis protein PilP [Herbaspirillum sp. YR522]EJN02929.1 type IV pilus biogenesis protein PilP [Herbaspirillum sp. YR522]